MSQDTFRHVLKIVGDKLDTNREENPTSLRPPQKLSIFLDFVRTNGFHRSVSLAQFNRVSKAEGTKMINYVAKTIADLRGQVRYKLVIFILYPVEIK